ncbi:siderophore-interacting protein [Kineococcus endophyticus]|uniref:Siderophore-interacting protein n=1 Tax=Kineococcus endophyticus TaxID=1181883 RepID=A0ABV3PC74_9ACTN
MSTPTTVSGFTADVENERTAQFWFDLVPRVLEVHGVTRLAARMVRVRFTGEDLHGFPTVAPEDHLKLFFDRAADGSPNVPVVGEDGRWNSGAHVHRDYTVRAFDPSGPFLDVDFVLHDHGVAGRWAGAARPGDRIAALGPRGAFLVKDVADWYVFAADETALPALARWVEGLRPGVPVTAFVEVSDAADEIPLASAADLDLHWLHRGAAPAGTTTLLVDALRAAELPAGTGYVWVAGEAISIKPARRYLSRDLRLDRDSYDVDGYWRRGTRNHDHHEDEPGDSHDE